METKIKQNLKKGIATFATLAQEVKSQRFPPAKIAKLFSLVPKEDYRKAEKEELLAYLSKLSQKNS